MAYRLRAVLECVVNVSEGRAPDVIARLTAAAGPCVLDVHSDADHNRTVLTLGGPDAALEASVRRLAAATVAAIDVTRQAGAHPRIGALDVVPFVALGRDAKGRLVDGPPSGAVSARNGFARWAGRELGLPCFLYGAERTLPDLRRQAWRTLEPDSGPPRPHPTAGAAAVGARPVLVAYNLWLAAGTDPALGRSVAAGIRRPGLRTLGLHLGERVQVSCNLVDPWHLGPGAAFDAVARALPAGTGIEHAELVGLLPRAVLEAEPPHRWEELGLGLSETIEARLEQAGLDGGSS